VTTSAQRKKKKKKKKKKRDDYGSVRRGDIGAARMARRRRGNATKNFLILK